MPTYDFRCKQCGESFSLHFKSITAYDQATLLCPVCGSEELSRLITSVAIPRQSHNYANMSSNEMLGVLESGDSSQVDEMFKQVGGSTPAQAPAELSKTPKPDVS